MKTKGVKIVLTKEKSEEIFHSALCNGLGYIGGYGMELDFSEEDYKQAKAKLKNPCYEDVLMKILKMGKTLKFIDHEGDGEYTRTISIKDVHERVAKTTIRHLVDMLEEEDDATTADVIIQSVLFDGEIIFG